MIGKRERERETRWGREDWLVSDLQGRKESKEERDSEKFLLIKL